MIRPSQPRITAAGQALTWANVHEFMKATVPAGQAKEHAGSGDLIAQAPRKDEQCMTDATPPVTLHGGK